MFVACCEITDYLLIIEVVGTLRHFGTSRASVTEVAVSDRSVGMVPEALEGTAGASNSHRMYDDVVFVRIGGEE